MQKVARNDRTTKIRMSLKKAKLDIHFCTLVKFSTLCLLPFWQFNKWFTAWIVMHSHVIAKANAHELIKLNNIRTVMWHTLWINKVPLVFVMLCTKMSVYLKFLCLFSLFLIDKLLIMTNFYRWEPREARHLS